jgi:hypothetical protein
VYPILIILNSLDIEPQELFSLIVETLKLGWVLSENFDHNEIEFTQLFINFFTENLSRIHEQHHA